jgi:hypothetical protein
MNKPTVSKVVPGMPRNFTEDRSGSTRSLSDARAEEADSSKVIAPPSALNKYRSGFMGLLLIWRAT